MGIWAMFFFGYKIKLQSAIIGGPFTAQATALRLSYCPRIWHSTVTRVCIVMGEVWWFWHVCNAAIVQPQNSFGHFRDLFWLVFGSFCMWHRIMQLGSTCRSEWLVCIAVMVLNNQKKIVSTPPRERNWKVQKRCPFWRDHNLNIHFQTLHTWKLKVQKNC